DIAVPRDVEAAAGEIEQVFLYDIDDLQATVRENLARRASEVARAEAIVAEEVEKFAAWLRSRGAIPTVVALRQRFEAIRRAELEGVAVRCGGLPGGRDHAPHRGKAAADADRAAQGAGRFGDVRPVRRGARAPLRPAGTRAPRAGARRPPDALRAGRNAPHERAAVQTLMSGR